MNETRTLDPLVKGVSTNNHKANAPKSKVPDFNERKTQSGNKIPVLQSNISLQPLRQAPKISLQQRTQAEHKINSERQPMLRSRNKRHPRSPQ